MVDEWTLRRCTSSVRTLKSKIGACKEHSLKFPSVKETRGFQKKRRRHDTSNGLDVGAQNLAEEYMKSNCFVKRRKSGDWIDDDSNNDYNNNDNNDNNDDDVDYQDDDHQNNQKDDTVPIVVGSIWRRYPYYCFDVTADAAVYLDDILNAYKSFLLGMLSELDSIPKLAVHAAIELGLFIALHEETDTKNLEQELNELQRDNVMEWYDVNPAMFQYRKFVVIGHAVGLLLKNIECVNPIMPEIILLCREHAFMNNKLFRLYVQNLDPKTFWENIDNIRQLADYSKTDFDALIFDNLIDKLEIGVLNSKTLETINGLLRKNGVHSYSKCLPIMRRIIEISCLELEKSSGLLETLGNLRNEQHIIIEQMSIFIQITTLDSKLPIINSFLTESYQLCKNGYRSFIPVLKFIKTFFNNTPHSIPKRLDKEQSYLLTRMFKLDCELTTYFILYLSKIQHRFKLHPALLRMVSMVGVPVLVDVTTDITSTNVKRPLITSGNLI